MSTATFTPIQGRRARGATATTPVVRTHDEQPAADALAARRKGGLLRAAKIFAGTAVSVVLLGEYAEDAGVIRR
ncbi:hypothetical protein [Streptomyces sp. G-G2]|uniref:hypothetical protein n=1 Tax=Streptomyces sp. G-G2 TaxID=3046201 RepID=UPI0024BB3B69|nr:hypothetical protein [Streptomyces sp. G-G2]MDJ0384613.1 hypothetical protein [Streptomyces sp. G-G2]